MFSRDSDGILPVSGPWTGGITEREIERLLKEVHDAEHNRKSKESPLPANKSVKKAKETAEIVVPADKSDLKLKGVVQNMPMQKPAIKQYRSKQFPLLYMTADRFIDPYYGNHAKVAERILDVLDQEAPISESLLTRRVVQSFSIARSGSRIQQYMTGIYKSLKLSYTVQDGEKIYWKHSQDPNTYSEFRANGEGDNKRDAKDIPVQEAANAVCRALEDQFSLSNDDLIRSAANLMGISRIGSAVSTLFQNGITLAEKSGRIQKADNGNWILNG